MSPAKLCSLPHAIHSSRAVVVGNGTYLGLKDLTFEIVEKLSILLKKDQSTLVISITVPTTIRITNHTSNYNN
jgi:hypothetical protein